MSDTKDYLTEAELLAHIRAEIARLGGIDAASEEWDMGTMFLRFVEMYHAFPAPPDDRFINDLGFERVVLYRRKDAPN